MVRRLILLMAILLLALPVAAATYFVNANGTNPLAPYASWNSAATNIQDAVDAATNGDLVLVTNGIYAFGGMNVYGSNRVAVTKPMTVQSVNGFATTFITGLTNPGVRCVFLTNGAALVGFTVTNGSAGSGGGVLGNDFSSVVSNCFIVGNIASSGGGAVDATLYHCILSGNYGNNGGGIFAAALYNSIISSNTAGYGGGCYSGNAYNCQIIGNQAANGGGGYNCAFSGCLLTGNTANGSFGGGAAYQTTLINCTVVGNHCTSFNGGVCGGAYSGNSYNSILYDNTSFSQSSKANYFNGFQLNCCTTPLPGSGSGNFASAPLFVNEAGGDFHLQTNSPCVNAGNNSYVSLSTDLDGNLRIIGLIVDVGAYEFATPTYFTVQPQSQFVNAGQTATFSALATGPYPVTYQWYFNGTAIGGATNTTLALPNINTNNNGSYGVTASNAFVTVSSTNASLTAVYPPPVILVQPVSVLTQPGSNVSFSVTVTNALPVTYQWTFNGISLTDDAGVSGSTTSNLNLTAVATTNAGAYRVIVANTFGSVTSAVAALSFPLPPQIIAEPASLMAVRYSSASFTVSAIEPASANYRWYFNATPLADGGRISGSGSTNLSIANLQTTDAGVYSVIVSNAYGFDTSSNATLTVARSMLVVWGGASVPPDATNLIALSAKGGLLPLKDDGTIAGTPGYSGIVGVASGYSHNLALAANGTIYGWGDDASGEIDIPSGLTNATAVGAGLQHSVALKSDGTVAAWGYGGYGETTVPANLFNVRAIAAGAWSSMAVDNDGNVFEWGANGVPAGLGPATAVASGYNYSLALLANGTVAAWGSNSEGETQVPAGLTNVVAISAGPFEGLALKNDGTLVSWGLNAGVPAGLSNVVAVSGAWNYNAAIVNDGSPWFGEVPLNQVVYAGSTATFNSTVLGQQPMSFQWQSNGVNIAWATNATLLVTNVQPGLAAQFDLVASNAIAVTTSPMASLSVLPTQAISVQPQNVTNNAGSTVTFTTSLVGQMPFTYQWQLNGTNLAGATNSSLTLTNTALNQSGVYTVTASNRYGSTSTNASLAILPWIHPVISPNTFIAGSGGIANFSLSAGGFSTNATYTWYLNGNNFMTWNCSCSGAGIGASTNVSGNYYVVGNDGSLSVTSSIVTLTVYPLAITAQPTNRAMWIGGTVRFAMSALGVLPINYQWQFNGLPISGANTNTLLLTNVQPSQLGTYKVVLSNVASNLVSTNVTLSLSQVAVWGGTSSESNLVVGLTNIMAISGGGSVGVDCAALNTNGTLITWPLVSNFAITNLIAVAGAEPVLGLKTNGTVISYSGDFPFIVSGMTNIAAIAPYIFGYLALKTNGTVIGSASVSGLTNMVAIAEGNGHGLALRTNGTVVAWGNNSSGQATVPLGLSNVMAIAAGYYHSLALKSNGTIVAWGNNSFGQATIPAGLNNVVAIAAGQYHTLALKSDGTVIAWGMNTYGQTNVPPGLSNVVAIAAGEYHSMALIGNGPPVMHAPLSNPALAPGGFNLSLPSQSGRTYMLEYKNSLDDSNWTSMPLVPGNGGTLLLTDPTATNSQRYYHVRRW